MKTLLRNADGERLIWWNWQNLAKPGQRRNARAWLHFYDNSIGVQWVFRPRNLSIGVTFADTTVDDDSLSFHFSIPFLIALYVSISRLPIVKRLPGVKYVSGKCDSGMRSIDFTYDRRENNWVHWRLWRNPHFGNSRDWRDDGLFVDDVIFGRDKYSEQELDSQPCVIVMPERSYNATARRYVATWTRKRWRKPKSINRVEIEVPEGIGTPGHGENSWDMDDDAAFEFTTNADTVEEAIESLRARILKERKKFGGEYWVPS
jgi:hypothetical protein